MTNYFPSWSYNQLWEGIIIVIYADVLFIVNFFINFFLLRLTARLTKKTADVKRLILSSALGGAYSLIILVDIPDTLSVVLKIAAGIIMVLCAFRFYRVGSFFVTCGVFLFSSLVFLGIIIGAVLLFKPDTVAVKNGSVYFDIGARGLIICSAFAYAVSSLIVRLYNRRLAAGDMYLLKIENGGKCVNALALADSGNRLREPFSGDSVIVVKTDIVKDVFDEKSLRLIPASTVNSSSYLKAFKPEKITVKNSGGQEVIENVYVAMSDEIKKDACSALINPEILSL